MILAMTLVALQPGGPVPDDRSACAPRQILTRGGPPPPVFHAQRMEITPRARTFLSVHRCPGGGFRVDRRRAGAETQDSGPIEWVSVSQCAAIGGWISAVTRLRLPSPMLREHRQSTGRQSGTWYTLGARTATGPGWPGRLELEILEPPGAPPSALSGWFGEGERLFQACRDQGQGGQGLLPARGRLRP